MNENIVRDLVAACNSWLDAPDEAARTAASKRISNAVEPAYSVIAAEFSRFVVSIYQSRNERSAEIADEFSRYVVSLYGQRPLSS
jgi:hypothetical protein